MPNYQTPPFNPLEEPEIKAANPFGFPEFVQPQNPYAVSTPMTAINPMSNPYGQGGGLRGRLRDALLAGGSAGHNRNRMDPVMRARMFDRGMAPEQMEYMEQQRLMQEYEQQQRDRTQLQKNKTAAYVDYARKTIREKKGTPMSMRAWFQLDDAARAKLLGADASGSTNVQSRFVGQNGNVHIVRRDGTVEDTGVKGSPPGTEIIDVGGVPYVKQTLPGGEESTVPLDDWQRQYRTRSLSAEKYAENQGTSWSETDAAFDNALINEFPAIQDTILEMKAIKEKYADGSLQEGIAAGGPLRKYFDPDAAEAERVRIESALKALQQYNLVPVSDTDFQAVKDMFGNAFSSGKVNEALLDKAIDRLDKLLMKAEKKRRYFEVHGTLKGYNRSESIYDLGDDYSGPKGTETGVIGVRLKGGS